MNSLSQSNTSLMMIDRASCFESPELGPVMLKFTTTIQQVQQDKPEISEFENEKDWVKKTRKQATRVSGYATRVAAGL